MTNPWDVIKALQANSKRLIKESILRAELDANNVELFEGFKYALNSLITFGVRQVPEHPGPDGPGLPWITFAAAIHSLMNRTITGNAARQLIDDIMAESTQDQFNNWYRRILIKDLRCGVEVTTVNKIVKKHPQFSIPVFSVQLAQDSKNFDEKMNGRKMIDVKLDGVRLITIVYPDGTVKQFSRNGKELVNFPKIANQFAAMSDKLYQAWVYDGEIMSDSFQDLMKQVQRKKNVKTDDAVLNLFDFLPLDQFQQGGWDRSQLRRREELKRWYNENKDLLPNANVIDYEIVDLDTEEGQARFKFINRRALEMGLEGIMIKDIDAPYQCKRSTNWLKLKPTITVDLKVIAVEEGTNENQGRLGALVCDGYDNGLHIRVNAGSGFTDLQRDNIWQNQQSVIGQTVEILADAVTKSQADDDIYSLRFPRFVRFRNDK